MKLGLKFTKNKQQRNFVALLLSGLAVSFTAFFSVTGAHASPQVTDYDAVPPLLSQSASPMIMLAMSNDHQLFYKSFTDYDDINGDGQLDTTYDNDIEYAGYFDSYKCYTYSGTVFEPASITTNKYCNASANSQWSGNFLNWATMTRIDQVRKVLYGGYRSVDSSESTVLERSYLPNDAHSFAKFYNGSDLKKLTPFDVTVNQSNTKDTGLTLCNTTYSRSTGRSQDVTAPPLMRVVTGNYSLWAANERYQCNYSDESSKSNGNDPATSGIYAYSGSPAKSQQATQTNGTKVGDYNVRVKACVSEALVGQEDCKKYPDGNYKPIGILQTFGDDGVTLWGLMTGSYKKNKSGGVLRKNIAPVTNEVNVKTDGTFIETPENGGIIDTINRFKIANYRHNSWYITTIKMPVHWGKNTFCQW
ncbi:MAG: hypothetical protein U5M23_02625 [Marinagarivorans sp.]|nr:hypothetical protein [Marinagarivorans sp.]